MKTSVYLTDSDEKSLKELAEKLERSASWIIRKSVSEYAKTIRKQEKPELVTV